MVRFIIQEIINKASGKEYLHSNMVRFIIDGKIRTKDNLYNIYIPIWLDLLSLQSFTVEEDEGIYIPIWLDLLLTAEDLTDLGVRAFTFQYG